MCREAAIDVRLPPTFTDEGLRTALEARSEIPGPPVLVLSQYVEQLYARELLLVLNEAVRPAQSLMSSCSTICLPWSAVT